MWDDEITFEECCASDDFDAGGLSCEHGTRSYANCCEDLKFWCGDDPTFTDAAGYTCAEWAAGEYSCVYDTGDYSGGDLSALWGACAASCGLCQEWQGEPACWSGEFSHSSCCTGDADGDGTPGDQNCWTEEHNFETCLCEEPTANTGACDENQVMLKPGADPTSTNVADYFVLSVAACDYGPRVPGQPGYTVPVHGLCVWETLWGNGYCDNEANSPDGPSYDSTQVWYNQWHANLNCAAADYGMPSALKFVLACAPPRKPIDQWCDALLQMVETA